MLNLDKVKKAYIIGIKGSGAVAVAQILKNLGVEVTGSDTDEKFFTDEVLKKNQIPYFEKWDENRIAKGIDLVIYSTAYNEKNNPELKKAYELGLKIMSYPEILGELFNQKYGIAVCGTHGKTTTTALLGEAMAGAGADPTVVVGSRVLNWNGGARFGKKDFFVAEADEYQNKLSFYNPKAVVFTSCDWDHPDFFETFEDYKKTFADFLQKIPKDGFLVFWGDSTSTLEASGEMYGNKISYGFSLDCEITIRNFSSRTFESAEDFRRADWFSKFDLFADDKHLGTWKMKLTGRHNALNTAAAVAVVRELKLNLEKARVGMEKFQGTARRFEYVGECNGALVLDDYAHHPEEVEATLKAAQEMFPKKNIWAIFHPHTYSRTQALLGEFSQCFSHADRVLVLDIYGSAREEAGSVSSGELVKLINTYDRGKASHFENPAEAAEYVGKLVGPDDVIITLGAGNVWEAAKQLTGQNKKTKSKK